MPAAMTGPRPATTLDRLPTGQSASVVAVGGRHAGELLREGIVEGALLTVRGVAPLGGPVIVELGRATVAVARPIAASVRVSVESGAG